VTKADKKNDQNDSNVKAASQVAASFGFGGILEGIGKLVELAAKVNEAGGQINKEGEINFGDSKKGAKGVFGFSVKTISGGQQVVEPFGNIKKTPSGPKVGDVREPIADVFDEKDEIRVYIEMPGVNEADIKIDLKGDILSICVDSGDRKYSKEILLPVKAAKEGLSSSYKNGILEIKVKK